MFVYVHDRESEERAIGRGHTRLICVSRHILILVYSFGVFRLTKEIVEDKNNWIQIKAEIAAEAANHEQ